MMTIQQAFISFLQSDEIQGVSNFRQINSSMTLFSYQEINFLFVYNEKDEHIFHLLVPKIEDYNSEIDEKMIDFTMNYKVAKVIRLEGSIWFSFEQIVFNQKEGDYRLFKLAIKILSSMLREWRSPSNATSST